MKKIEKILSTKLNAFGDGDKKNDEEKEES